MQEIQTPEFGCGLDGVIRAQAKIAWHRQWHRYAGWNPQSDPHLAASFSADDLSGKADCAEALRKEVELLPMAADRNVCLVGLVSRLVGQKASICLCCGWAIYPSWSYAVGGVGRR